MAETEGVLGAAFSIDVTDLKAGLNQANRLIRESESEFKSAAAGMDDWSGSQEGLEARVKSLNEITDIQRKKVNALQSEYDRLIAEGLDPTSKEAVELRTKINNETAALNKNEKSLGNAKKALEEFGNTTDEAAEDVEDLGEEAEDSGGKLDKLKTAGGAVVGGIAAIGAACVGAVAGFLSLGESTKELQTQMARTEQAFATAGFSADTATESVVALEGVLGDAGRATEAASLLAKMSKDEADLEANTRILTGVFAEFGDSIPTEGLAEGMQATAEMGTVQGVLADALEWQGVNLDDYNAKLAEMTTAEERAAYIQQSLTDIYGESADAYRENNAALIENNEAQANLNQVLADIGAVAMPIMTTLKTLAADLLTELKPFIVLIGEGLQGALNGSDGAAEKLASGLSGIISAVLDLAVKMIPTIIQTISAIIPQVLQSIVSQLPAILSAISLLAVQIVQILPGILGQIVQAVTELLPMLLELLITLTPELLSAAVQFFMAIVQALPEIIQSLLLALPMLIESLLGFLSENFPILLQGALDFLLAVVECLPTVIGQLHAALPMLISSITSFLANNVPLLVSAAIQLYFALIQAIPEIVIELGKNIPSIITAIIGGLEDGISLVKDVGSNLIRGLWEGINDMASWIAGKIQGFGENVLGGIKDFFGIESPSRVMADVVGKNLALGIGEGFGDSIGSVNDEITSAMNFADPNISVNGGNGVAAGAGGVVVYQTNNYAQAHSRIELYKTKQATAAAVRLAMGRV